MAWLRRRGAAARGARPLLKLYLNPRARPKLKLQYYQPLEKKKKKGNKTSRKPERSQHMIGLILVWRCILARDRAPSRDRRVLSCRARARTGAHEEESTCMVYRGRESVRLRASTSVYVCVCARACVSVSARARMADSVIGEGGGGGSRRKTSYSPTLEPFWRGRWRHDGRGGAWRGGAGRCGLGHGLVLPLPRAASRCVPLRSLQQCAPLDTSSRPIKL